MDSPGTDALEDSEVDSRCPKSPQSNPRERQYTEGLLPLDIRLNETVQSESVLNIGSPPINKEDW